MSRAAFVDTSAWYAVTDVDDDHHEQATMRMGRLVEQRRPLVTSNHVAGETYTLLRVRLGAIAGQEFLRRLRRSSTIQRIFISEAWGLPTTRSTACSAHDPTYLHLRGVGGSG